MSENTGAVRFLYSTAAGRSLLKVIQKTHLDRCIANFLWTRCSRPFIGWYEKKNNIPLTAKQKASFHSYRDFFVRTRKPVPMDLTPEHLISPCDALLSVFPIAEDFSQRRHTEFLALLRAKPLLIQGICNGLECFAIIISCEDFSDNCRFFRNDFESVVFADTIPQRQYAAVAAAFQSVFLLTSAYLHS